MYAFARAQKYLRRAIEVLLVEDDDIDARIINLRAGLVEGFRLGVTRVNSLDGAKALLQSGRFDICLVDVRPEPNSAFEFLAELERINGDIGAVILSNIPEEDATRLRLAAGRNYVLPKVNCTPQRLETAIKAVIARQQLNAHPGGGICGTAAA